MSPEGIYGSSFIMDQIFELWDCEISSISVTTNVKRLYQSILLLSVQYGTYGIPFVHLL
jgi:hypothetical protein